MNMDDMTELAFTRILWREKLAALPGELWHGLRRLLTLEQRYWLVLDGRPVAKFTADADHLEVLRWLAESHKRATNYGMAIGREYFAPKPADAGDPGTS